MMKAKKRCYFVPVMLRELAVGFDGIQQDIPCTGIADGCCGVGLWFTNKRKALQYANKRCEVIDFEKYGK